MTANRESPSDSATREDRVDPGTRSQVEEFLRMTPSERLRSLVNTVRFVQRARESLRASQRVIRA